MSEVSVVNNENLLIESSLSQEELAFALGYVCYERNYIYLFKKQYGLEKFPLFYIDRFLGWEYSDSVEPLVPLSNGFLELLSKHVKESGETPLNEFEGKLEELFSLGHKVSIPMTVEHVDGTSYVTSVLLDGFDDKGIIYFTKTNETWNKICSPMDLNEFKGRLNPIDGMIQFEIIKYSEKISSLAKLSDRELANEIFSNLYGISNESDKFYQHNGTELKTTISGLTEYVESLSKDRAQILDKNGVPKHFQFRMHKHIDNKIRPLINFIHYVLNSEELSCLMKNSLREDATFLNKEIEIHLNNVFKWASLIVSTRKDDYLDSYVDEIKSLERVMTSYLTMFRRVVVSIMETNSNG